MKSESGLGSAPDVLRWCSDDPKLVDTPVAVAVAVPEVAVVVDESNDGSLSGSATLDRLFIPKDRGSVREEGWPSILAPERNADE